jgi:GT2 family glycosyltransferase
MDVGFQILISYHGQYKLVRELVGSIFLHTRNIPFRITLIDDGSPNKDFFSTMSSMDSQVDGIRFEKSRGLGAALNEGIKLTKEPWLVFLNSDCIIHEMDWLLSLHQCLESNMSNKVGLVSATMNNGGNSALIERKRTATRSDDVIVVDEALPLICTMAPRKLFDKIGLFKEYEFGYFEDEEFFWRMKIKGYKQGVCERAWVEHIGGVTTQALWESDPSSKAIMLDTNRKRCAEDIKSLLPKKT